MCGRNKERGKERVQAILSQGGSADFFSFNATEKSSFNRLIDQAKSDSRAIDILILGAGVNAAIDFFDVPENEFDNTFEVNTKCIAHGLEVVGAHMKERGKGSIITIGSVSQGPPLSKVLFYAASKAAASSLTKNYSRELAPYGVRVNTLVPGFFPAEQNKKVLTTERTKQIHDHTSIGRFGEPEELESAVLFLAGDGSKFVIGTDIVVDGGFLSRTI